ncbi:MAG: ABC transporter permease, partial [Haliea sp.]
MSSQLRELQVTPVPDTIDAPGLGFLTVGSGLNWPRFPATAFLRDVGRRLLPWVVPVFLIAVWQIASSLGWLSTRVLPAPLEVVKAAWTLTASGELWTHVKVSAG